MLTFTIIVFGLATVRTITPMANEKNIKLPQIALAITMIIAYVWFLNQFISLNN